MNQPFSTISGSTSSFRPSYRVALLLACFILLLAVQATAGDITSYVNKGKARFAAGDYQSAYDQFFQAFLLAPDNPEINFLLGRAAFERGDYEAAVMAFDRVLIADPKALRVKLEMARSFSALKSYEAARQYLLEVLAANPPDQVRANIQAMLDQLEQQQKHHHLHGMLALGYSYDDNARTVPNSETIMVPGLNNFPFSFNKESDSIYSSTLSLNHIYMKETLPFSWKSEAVNYVANYQSENDLDINYLHLGTGPAWQLGNNLFEVRPHFGLVDLGHHRYLQLYGMKGIWTNQSSATSFLQLALSGESRRNYEDPSRNSTNLLLEINHIAQFEKNSLVINAAVERENADNSIYSYYKILGGLQYSRSLPYALRANAAFSFWWANYDGIDPLWGHERTDDIFDFSVGITRNLWTSANRQQNIIANLSFSHEKSNSSLDFYTYDKNVVNLSVAYAF